MPQTGGEVSARLTRLLRPPQIPVRRERRRRELGLLTPASGATSSTVVLLAGVALFGVTVGNVLILAPIVLVSAFGVSDYPSIYSVNQPLMTVGIAAGPVLIGVLRGATAGYTTPLLIAALASLAAAGALALAHPPDKLEEGSP